MKLYFGGLNLKNLGTEYLSILDSIMEITPKPTDENISLLKDLLGRLDDYYKKSIQVFNMKSNSSIHFGLSDDLVLGVKTGLLINNQIYLQDIALLNHVSLLQKVMSEDGMAFNDLVFNLRYFVKNVRKISDLIENNLVIYVPHRSLWHIYLPDIGKQYAQFKQSSIYSLLTQGIRVSQNVNLPSYTIEGIVASSLVGISPITDDWRVLYSLDFIESTLYKDNIQGIESFYFEELRSMKTELELIQQTRIDEALKTLTAEQIIELQKNFDPTKINNALLKMDRDEIDSMVSNIFSEINSGKSILPKIALTAFDGLSLLGASVFLSLPPFIALIAPLVAEIDFAKGVVEFIFDLKDRAREVYDALFKRHIRILKKEHKEILKIATTAKKDAQQNKRSFKRIKDTMEAIDNQ